VGCIIKTLQVITKIVMTHNDTERTPPEEPVPLVVGGDELQPLFLYIVLFSGCTDLYACMDFIEYCALLDWRTVDGQVIAQAHSVEAGLPLQAGHLVVVVRGSLQLLQELARKLATQGRLPPGPLPFGSRSPEPAPGSPRPPLLESWVWSWADDTNPGLGRKQDKWVPYPLAFSKLLEDAVAAGNTRVVVTGRNTHHVDLEGWEATGVAWQVVSADPPPGRRR
jgi:hypothetical protein